MTIIDEQGREISEHGEIVAYQPEPFRILDIYSEDGTTVSGQRPDWIGVISAGFRNKDGWPEMSKDGTIYVAPSDRERAKHLVAALAANDNKRLTICFMDDDLDSIIIQRFARRSATALEVYGDQHKLTEIKLVGHEPEFYANGKPKIDKETGQPVQRPIYEHVTYMAGSPEYKALLRTCKTEVHVLFALAEWEGMRPVVKFPDGVGPYALRFTSRNSLQAIAGKLLEISTKMTRGRIAGIPFELSISYREVSAPDGKKRKVAVWRLDFDPPQMVRLVDSGNLQHLLSAAIDEGRRLRGLPAPAYGIEQAMAEEPDVDLEMGVERAVEMLTNGDPPCDARYWEAQWFVSVRGTRFESDEARGDFISNYTHGHTDSLSEFLSEATEQEASELLAFLDHEIQASKVDSMRQSAERFQAMDGDDDPAWKRTQEREAARKAALEAAGMDSVLESEGQQVTLTDAEYREIEPTDDAAQAAEIVTDVADQRWVWWNQVNVACKKEGIELPTLALPIPAADLDREIAEAKAAVLRARGVKSKQPAAT